MNASRPRASQLPRRAPAPADRSAAGTAACRSTRTATHRPARRCPPRSSASPPARGRGPTRSAAAAPGAAACPAPAHRVAGPRAAASARKACGDRLEHAQASWSARRCGRASGRASRAASSPTACRMARVVRLGKLRRHPHPRMRRGSRMGCRRAAWPRPPSAAASVNQLRLVVVAERGRREDPGLRGGQRAVRSACSRMSSGDSTSRASRGPTSIQRTCSSAARRSKRRGAAATAPPHAADRRAEVRRRRQQVGERLDARCCSASASAVERRPKRRAPARSSQRSLMTPRSVAQRDPRRPGAGRAPRVRTGGQLRPGAQAARLLQARGQQVAREVDHLAGAELRAEELHAGFDQLVRLVEHRRIDRRQQLGHAAVAQRHVGKEQVVVDDHQVGRHRVAPRLHHVAGAIRRALGAQAVVARRRDQRDHRRTVVQAVESRPGRRCAWPWPIVRCAPARAPQSGRAAWRSGAPAAAGAGTDSWRGLSAAPAAPAGRARRVSRGRSRRNSWSCRLLVAVLTSARRPDSSSGTR